MSSTKAASVPGIQLQLPKNIDLNPQTVTDADGIASPLQLSKSAVYVEGNGRFGINAIPVHALHVGVDRSVRFELGSTSTFQIGGSGDVYIDAPGVSKGRFLVTNAGRVGINQTNPQAQLDVNGTVRATGLNVNGTISATGLTFTGELAVPGMKPETSAPPGAKLEAVYIDRATGILYYHNHP